MTSAKALIREETGARENLQYFQAQGQDLANRGPARMAADSFSGPSILPISVF